MILVAHQPVFMPWLGWWHKLAMADVYCVFDVTQYERHSYENRNEVKTSAGKTMLTVPVESKDHFSKTIGDIRIVPGPWSRKHVRTLELAYAQAPYFKDYMPTMAGIFSRSYDRLAEINFAFIRFGMDALGLDMPVVWASELDLKGTKSDLVLDLCWKLHASEYWFGKQGRDYANVENFEMGGVTPHFQDYQHPTYRQLHGPFVSHLSFIDLLMNEGPRSLEIIQSGNVTRTAARATVARYTYA